MESNESERAIVVSSSNLMGGASKSKEAIVITATNLKGGVGKTTFIVTMADALAREKKRVLVIDMDGQANTSRILSDSSEPAEKSMADILLSGDVDLLMNAIRRETNIDGVHHIPARIRMHSLGYAEELRSIAPNPYKILQRRLRPLLGLYDFILIDTPPRLDLITMNAIAASDGYVVPFESGDIYALDGMEEHEEVITKYIKDPDVNPGIKFLGAVLQQHSDSTHACRVTKELVQRRYEILGEVPNREAVKKAAMKRQTIMQMERRNAASESYALMALKILKKFGVEPGKKSGRQRKEV